MPDYEEMYLDLFRAVEKAVDILIAARQRCEERYISAVEPEVLVLPAGGSADVLIENRD